MKNELLKFILFFLLSIISINLFAQGPPDPGDDPVSPSNNLNQKVIVPKDTSNNMHTDTSKVLTVENLLPVNYFNSILAKSKICYLYSEEKRLRNPLNQK